MIGLISDLIVISLVLLGLTIVCAALGHATFRLIGVANAGYLDSGTLWLGLTTLLALIESLHFFVPIDWRVSILVFIVSLLSLLSKKYRLEIKTCLNAVVYFARKNYFKTFVISLFVLIWCLRSMGLSNNFDSGLYHFGSIRWLNEYPIIPGLGNVHWRLALNQSYFGFLSLVNIYPFWNKGYAVGGLFILCLTFFTLIETGSKQNKAWRWLFGGTIFIYLGYLAGTLPNPSPDTAVGFFEIAMFLFLIRIIQKGKFEQEQKLKYLVVIFSLALGLVTIKLSGIMFAATSIILVICFQYLVLSQYFKSCLKLAIFLFLVGTVHMLRGYLLSGLPVFPSTVASAWSLDWAVSSELVNFEVNLIYSWGRQPGEMLVSNILGQWGWISGWLSKLSMFDGLVFGIGFVLMFLNLILSLGKKTSNETQRFLSLYLPLISAIIFWFFTAPDVRFLGAVQALFLGLSMWIFSLLLSSFNGPMCSTDRKHNRYKYWIFTIFISLMSLKLTGLRSISWTGWTPVPEYQVRLDKTYTDLPINVSTENGQCWNAPLPCMSIFNGNLHADPIIAPWPLSILLKDRFFYSVKFLNLQK